MYLKQKCTFFMPDMEYLGHKICQEGLQLTETKKVRSSVSGYWQRRVTEAIKKSWYTMNLDTSLQLTTISNAITDPS